MKKLIALLALMLMSASFIYADSYFEESSTTTVWVEQAIGGSSGSMEFEGDIFPSGDNVYDSGSTSRRWANGYFVKINADGSFTTNTSSITIGGDSYSIELDSNVVINGTLSVSGVTTGTGGFTGDLTGDVTGDVTGNVTGNLTGDVTATKISTTYLTVTSTAGAATLNTGQGDNELFDMNQNVQTTDDVTFGTVTIKGANLSGNCTAQFYYGDGSNLSGVAVSTSPIEVEDLAKVINGTTREDILTSVTFSGGVASLTLDNEDTNGSPLSLFIEDSEYSFVTSSSVALTAGTDASPQLNYTYILLTGTTPVLTNALTAKDKADTDYVECARILLGTVHTSSGTVFKHHETSDDLTRPIKHSNDRERLNTIWENGVAPTLTITANGAAVDDVIFTCTSGLVWQLHPHTFPAFDVNTTSPTIYVVNASTPNLAIIDISSILELSDGSAITNNSRFSYVIWGAVNESTDTCKLFMNLPSGTYINDDAAISDGNKYSNFNIPRNYRGVGFLIARLVLKYTTGSGGTWTSVQTEDLRGQEPSTSAGSGSVASTDFADNEFSIFDNTDGTKIIDFDAGTNITTGNTRTIIMADEDIDLSAIPAVNIDSGTMGAGVVVSSVAFVTVGSPQIKTLVGALTLDDSNGDSPSLIMNSQAGNNFIIYKDNTLNDGVIRAAGSVGVAIQADNENDDYVKFRTVSDVPMMSVYGMSVSTPSLRFDDITDKWQFNNGTGWSDLGSGGGGDITRVHDDIGWDFTFNAYQGEEWAYSTVFDTFTFADADSGNCIMIYYGSTAATDDEIYRIKVDSTRTGVFYDIFTDTTAKIVISSGKIGTASVSDLVQATYPPLSIFTVTCSTISPTPGGGGIYIGMWGYYTSND